MLKYNKESTHDVFRGKNVTGKSWLMHLKIRTQQVMYKWSISSYNYKKEDSSEIFASYKQTRKGRLICFEVKRQQQGTTYVFSSRKAASKIPMMYLEV